MTNDKPSRPPNLRFLLDCGLCRYIKYAGPPEYKGHRCSKYGVTVEMYQVCDDFEAQDE